MHTYLEIVVIFHSVAILPSWIQTCEHSMAVFVNSLLMALFPVLSLSRSHTGHGAPILMQNERILDWKQCPDTQIGGEEVWTILCLPKFLQHTKLPCYSNFTVIFNNKCYSYFPLCCCVQLDPTTLINTLSQLKGTWTRVIFKGTSHFILYNLNFFYIYYLQLHLVSIVTASK